MIDLHAIEARIRDCKTYNFGLWNADKLAHEDAPAMLTELRHLRVIASGNQGAIVNSIIERTRTEPTDDEREARPCHLPQSAPPCIGCRCEPQGEPSDAQVTAALSVYLDTDRAWADWETWQIESMRAALRAAWSIR